MDRLARFAWFTLAYNVAVILWGAVVRATGSGAGCGAHWPLCNGEVVPRSPSVATLVEFSHRATSGIALLFVVALLVAAWRSRPPGSPTRRGAVASMVLMLTEAGVGAGLVLFQLVADNQSVARALFMAVHLVNTFFLLAALTLTAHWASGGQAVTLRGRSAAGLYLWTVGALVVAGMSGAVAALGDTLFPSMTLDQALATEASATAHALIRLRVLHPVLSLAAAVLVAVAAWRLLDASPERARLWAITSFGLCALQLAVGVVNVLLMAPVWLQIVHLLVADLLWIAVVLLGAHAYAEAQP
jgi:heme A synthase